MPHTHPTDTEILESIGHLEDRLRRLEASAERIRWMMDTSLMRSDNYGYQNWLLAAIVKAVVVVLVLKLKLIAGVKKKSLYR